MVSDLPDLGREMEYQHEFYQGVTNNILDGYSVELEDYLHYDVISRLDTPQGRALLAIVDPYAYKDRASGALLKYYVFASEDQFFVPGSAQIYINALQGPTYLRYVPNAGHPLNTDAATSVMNFYAAEAAGDTLPTYNWSITNDGNTIQLNASGTPVQVLLWQATNPVNRDFRDYGSAPTWTSTVLTDQGGGSYVAHINTPPSGATGAFIEVWYNVNGLLLKFTSSISVVSALAATSNTVEGNYIGTNVTGLVALANTGNGITIDNCAGTLLADNLIFGNTGNGVSITGNGAIDTTVQGNTIAFNGGAGVVVVGASCVGNRIQANAIYSNGALGIDLGNDGVTANDAGDADTGPNLLQNYPIITAAEYGVTTHLSGALNSTANKTFTLDFYANAAPDSSGYGQGQRFLGSATVTTGGTGNATFNVTLASATTAGEWITATATDPNGNTSEFSIGRHCRLEFVR